MTGASAVCTVFGAGDERAIGGFGRSCARNKASADVFDIIERFYNAIRRHKTIGSVSPVWLGRKVGLA